MDSRSTMADNKDFNKSPGTAELEKLDQKKAGAAAKTIRRRASPTSWTSAIKKDKWKNQSRAK